MFSRNLDTGLRGAIEEMLPVGDRILVAFRPELPRDDGRRLDDGLAYVVVTMRGHRYRRAQRMRGPPFGALVHARRRYQGRR